MQSDSNLNKINLFGSPKILDKSLSKLRLSRASYHGFFTQVKNSDISEGIFIPSLCYLTESSIEYFKNYYGTNLCNKMLLDRNFVKYINDDILIEGLWISIKAFPDIIKNEIYKNKQNINLKFLKDIGVIHDYSYFEKLMHNDIRMVNLENEKLYVHELIHGINFEISGANTLFGNKIKINNNSINDKQFQGKYIANKLNGLCLKLVESGNNLGPVCFHLKNSHSNMTHGRLLFLDYDNIKRYFIKSCDKTTYKGLKELSESIEIEMQPFIKEVKNDNNLFNILEGISKTSSILSNKNIKKGFEIYTDSGNSYTYLSPLYLTSCSESTIWS